MSVPTLLPDLDGASRVLRTVSTTDAPYPGVLVGGEVVTLWVDIEDFAGPAWRGSPDGHLLAPRDIARTATGHAVVLAHCTERATDAIDRREVVTAGEAVTIGVSIVRAAVEAIALGAENGTWWLTDEARPVLAITGNLPWHDEAIRILAMIAVGQPDALHASLAAVSAALATPRRLARDADDLENALFVEADAAPLVTDSLAPLRARRLAIDRSAAGQPEPRERMAPLRDAIARHVDAAWADAVVGALRRVRVPRGRPRVSVTDPTGTDAPALSAAPAPASARRHPRAPVLLGVGLAAAILVVGAAWPQPDESKAIPQVQTPQGATASVVPSAASDPSTASDASAASDPSIPAISAAPSTPATPASVTSAAAGAEDASALLDRFAACTEAPTPNCRAETVEDPAREFPVGIAGAQRPRTVTLIEDLGGVQVLRVQPLSAESDSAPAQIVVIVREGAEWLVRDVYDIVEQL